MVENEKKLESASPRSSRGFQRSVAKQVLLGMLTNFSSIAPSMSLGFSAVALPVLTDPTNPNYLDKEKASWFASIASLATPFGCILSGPISDRYGRKTAIFCVNVISFIGWVIIAAAYHYTEYQYLILLCGRLLTGLSTGLSSTPATVYMAEISTPKLRGVFCTWNTVSFALGVLIVYSLGYILPENWGMIALLTAVLPIIGMIFIVFLVPESPSWLIRKEQYDKAKINMCKIFGAKAYIPEVQSEVETLISERGIKVNPRKKTVGEQIIKKIRYLLEPSCLKPLGLIVTFFFFQQMSGTFVVVFYAIDIVKDAGITFDPYLTIVIIGVVRLLASILVSYISKMFGRRPLSIISGSCMTLCMSCLAGYIIAHNQDQIPDSLKDYITFLPLTLLLLYFLTSTLGFVPIPFAMSPEVFSTKIRGTASSIASGMAYLFNFAMVKLYSTMIDSMGRDGIFFFYGAVSLVGTIFVITLLPETKGKTLAEIEESFTKKNTKRDSQI